jgi:hypothetical protein
MDNDIDNSLEAYVEECLGSFGGQKSAQTRKY